MATFILNTQSVFLFILFNFALAAIPAVPHQSKIQERSILNPDQGTNSQGTRQENYQLQSCDNHYCSNNGICSRYFETTFCVCNSGFTGERCDQVTCGSLICNHGTCATLSHFIKYCRCEPGFYGNLCDKSYCDDLMICSGYRQACIGEMDGKGYQCDCPGQRTGEKCEEPPCTVNPCLNGGTCTAVDDIQATCACQPGYTGVRCETSM